MGAAAQARGKKNTTSMTRAQGLALTALSIALIAVGAWITVPIGPIPFTLQVFVVTLVLLVLPDKLPIAAVAGYLVLGAVGVPVFSGMRGGIGMLMGPTGGFLIGYLVAAIVCVPVARLIRGARPESISVAREVLTGVAVGVVYLLIIYVCGWAQYIVVANVTPEQSFAVTVAPFVVVDAIKIVAAIVVSLIVRRALGIFAR